MKACNLTARERDAGDGQAARDGCMSGGNRRTFA